MVVRLKGGDPYVFGRGAEEAQHLARNGVPFEVVPGGGGFCRRRLCRHSPHPPRLHHQPRPGDRPRGPGQKDVHPRLGKAPTGVGTLIFYMGMANLPLIAEKLIAHGRPASTPVAVVRWATTPRQQTLTATLGDVVEKVRESGIKPPAVILVGDVVALREELRWFDTRPSSAAGPRHPHRRADRRLRLPAGSLRRRGGPLSGHRNRAPPKLGRTGWGDRPPCGNRLSGADLANGVEAFFARLRAAGLDLRALKGVTVVAVGPKTAAAVEALGLRPDLMPDDFRAEGVVALLAEQNMPGKRVLYPRAELARDVIPRELAARGATVAAPVAYRTLPPADGAERVRRVLEESVDAVNFTSSSTVDNFLKMAGDDGRKLLEKAAVFSIGPQTTATATRHGVPVAAEASRATLEGLVEAMVEYFAQHPELKVP